MKPLTKKQIFKYLKILNKYKDIVGFAGWKIFLSSDVAKSGDIANISTDELEKELKVELFSYFMNSPEEKQINILIHELIHARVAYYKSLCDRATAFFEEDLVNDLTRGYERMIDDFK